MVLAGMGTRGVFACGIWSGLGVGLRVGVVWLRRSGMIRLCLGRLRGGPVMRLGWAGRALGIRRG
jgi:hypothetical protein